MIRIMSFSEAFFHIIANHRVRRTCWPDGQWLKLTGVTHIHTDALGLHGALEAIASESTPGNIHIKARIDKKLNPYELLVGWTPSTEDLFAHDWEVVS